MKKIILNRTLVSTILTLVILALVTGAGLGFAIGHWWLPPSTMSDVSSGMNDENSEPEILYWVAPMDSNYRRDEPGQSPMGMDLVPVYADPPAKAKAEAKILYWVAPMDSNYRRDAPGQSPMGMDLVPVYADEDDDNTQNDASIVKINPAIINNLGVRSALVEQSNLARRIETVGYVAYDADNTHQINTRAAGWVEKLAINAAGESVKQGQVLFELYSPELVNAQQEYLAALNSKSIVLQKASRQRLSALGISNAEITRLERNRTVRQRIRIYAKADGVVAHLSISEGAYITPATEVMSITDLNQVWVLAEVFERQVAWVELGQQAEVELDYLPGQRWRGTVDYIYPELDPKTRTLKVRLRFDNESQVFRPNMFARVSILGTERSSVLHIPREALIRGGAIDRVVLNLGDGKFKAQAVVPGFEVSGRVEIRSGLTVGDRIVVSGQFLIDSESNIESALARMNSDEPQDPHVGHDMDDSMEKTQ